MSRIPLIPLEAARAWLAGRAPRERKALLAAGAVVALALGLTLVDGFIAAHQRLDQQLPALRAELARMQDDAAELARLSALPETQPPAAGALADAARAAAAARGLALEIVASGDRLEVRGNARLDTLVDWLAALQTEQGLRPLRLAVNGTAIEASLTR